LIKSVREGQMEKEIGSQIKCHNDEKIYGGNFDFGSEKAGFAGSFLGCVTRERKRGKNVARCAQAGSDKGRLGAFGPWLR
jgi:hypothetical protein